ncbi:MAG TPA: ATP-binding cassette domain-containing protein [Anaerolineae bacterium]|nr:ATP-binding cassette domain-containing protein [Anaerolineae bacterium]
MQPILEAVDASYAYELKNSKPIEALKGVTLKIEEGEFVALIGHNGSGKTTLARLFNGLLQPSSGKVFIDGMDTSYPANFDTICTLVGMVFQNANDQIFASVVEEDIAFGPSNLGLPPQKIREHVDAAIRQTRIAHLRLRQTFLLSAGETQRVALAGVLAMQPRCLIFDETTAMLDPFTRHALLQFIKELHQSGFTIIMITHLMAEAVLAQRVIALYQGKVVLDDSPGQVFADRAYLRSIGLDASPAAQLTDRLRVVFPALPTNILNFQELQKKLPCFHRKTSISKIRLYTPKEDTGSARVIDANGLAHIYMQGTPLAHQALKGVSLSVEEGRVKGLAGATGSGKSTLLQHLNGLLRPQEGELNVVGFDLTDAKTDVRTLRRKVGLVFQNPEEQFFKYFVGDEVAYGPRMLGCNGSLENIVKDAMQKVGLGFNEFKDRPLASLSGGERRRVALASFLAIQPEVLLLDEPFAGLDPKTHLEMLDVMQNLNQAGKTIVLSTHNMHDLNAFANQVTVLHKGEDVFHGNPIELFAKQKRISSWGLIPPLISQTTKELCRKGWPLEIETLTAQALVAEIKRIKGITHGG